MCQCYVRFSKWSQKHSYGMKLSYFSLACSFSWPWQVVMKRKKKRRRLDMFSFEDPADPPIIRQGFVNDRSVSESLCVWTCVWRWDLTFHTVLRSFCGCLDFHWKMLETQIGFCFFLLLKVKLARKSKRWCCFLIAQLPKTNPWTLAQVWCIAPS